MADTLTMDDLERMKQLAHYQKLVRESDRTEALKTLAHYQAMLTRADASLWRSQEELALIEEWATLEQQLLDGAK